MECPPQRKILLHVFVLVLVVAITAFQTDTPGIHKHEALAIEEASADSTIIEITALDHAFRAPEEIPSGWITYRVNNERADEIHEVSLALLPEGKTQEDYLAEVIPIWEAVWERIHTGEITDQMEAARMANELLPEWNRDVRYVRARGLVSPGRSTMNTQYLAPGNYALSCWLKSADGQLHISHGMSRPLTVTEKNSGNAPPEPDLEISIIHGKISNDGILRTGTQNIALLVEDEDARDNVHLVRMDDDTDLATVATWMNWYAQGGLQSPAPAEFLGGVHVYGNTYEGARAYFTVEDVQPGRYAWIVQAPADEQLWEVFSVE